MPGDLIIRFVTRQDYAQWLPLWNGYNAFYGRSGPTALAPEITAMSWARFFDAYEPVHALVAESEGELLGLVHYLFHRNTSMIPPTCYLQDLFTAEAARGKGVGRALLARLAQIAVERDCGRLEWAVLDWNKPSIDFYRSLGALPQDEWTVYRLTDGALATLGARGSTSQRPTCTPSACAPSARPGS
jgi:GNAT superfamily N-acetyltransferase